MVRLTCYGGVGQIGGNKILLEDVPRPARDDADRPEDSPLSVRLNEGSFV